MSRPDVLTKGPHLHKQDSAVRKMAYKMIARNISEPAIMAKYIPLKIQLTNVEYVPKVSPTIVINKLTNVHLVE